MVSRIWWLCLLVIASSWPLRGLAAAEFPKNLLRTHAGARWIQGSGPSINDDPTIALGVSEGEARWIADLGQHHVVDRLTLQQVGLVGSLSVEATPSLHLPRWQSLGRVDLQDRKSVVSAPLIPTVGRYLRFTLVTKSKGRLMGLGIFGPLRVSELRLVPTAAWAEKGSQHHLPETFSLLNGLSKGSVVSVSSGEGSSIYLRDEDVSTFYQFSDQQTPSIDLDLGITLNLKGLVVLQNDASGFWTVQGDEERVGMVTQGVARIDLNGRVARTLRLSWSGTGDPPRVFEIAVFPQRGLVKTSGYGKNESFGKNVSFGKQSLALKEETGQSPKVDGTPGNTFSPYFGIRGAGALPGPNGFPTRVAGGGSDDTGGGPVITPGSF